MLATRPSRRLSGAAALLPAGVLATAGSFCRRGNTTYRRANVPGSNTDTGWSLKFFEQGCREAAGGALSRAGRAASSWSSPPRR